MFKSVQCGVCSYPRLFFCPPPVLQGALRPSNPHLTSSVCCTGSSYPMLRVFVLLQIEVAAAWAGKKMLIFGPLSLVPENNGICCKLWPFHRYFWHEILKFFFANILDIWTFEIPFCSPRSSEEHKIVQGWWDWGPARQMQVFPLSCNESASFAELLLQQVFLDQGCACSLTCLLQ